MTHDARPATTASLRFTSFVMAATLLGFALRLPFNDSIPPRWDEGWSIAHASLGLGELLRVTAADVHPPLYYLLLKVWQALLGHNLFAARFLSVMLSSTAVPLTFVVAKAWSGSSRLAVIAALVMAWLPLGVYYGAVVRMYALAPSFVLLAAYGALRLGIRAWRLQFPSSNLQSLACFVIGAVSAMLTLYHAIWALTAIAVYALAMAVRNRRRTAMRNLIAGIGVSVLLYLPWGAFAIPQFFGRAAAESATNIGQQFPLTYFLRQGIYDLTMSRQIGGAGLIVTCVIVAIGLALALARRVTVTLLLLPALMIAFTLLGVAFAARQWAFNARMLICAVPALALLLAWAFDQLLANAAERRTQDASHRTSFVMRLTSCVLGIALFVIYFSTSADFVYRKTLEVFDPYNPHTYREHIAPFAHPNDLVFFNVLSPAGFYALDRQPGDPAWSYALTWDPVIEPRERWEQRIGAATTEHNRLWLVLYRGLAGKNGDLRGWMDSNFYPSHSAWGEEGVYYGLYGAPKDELKRMEVDDATWGNIRLDDIRIGTYLRAGEILPIALTWQATTPITTNYKVFVHAAKPDGFILAQHDAQPLNDLRPMTTWTPDEPVRDNHGLALPAGYTGDLKITLGLYNPTTGERLKTDTGQDAISIGTVTVK